MTLRRARHAAAALALWAVLPSASAHAELVAMEPERDTVVPAPPATVALVFSEPVEVRFARIEVNRLDAEVAAEPDFLRLNGLASVRAAGFLDDEDASRVDTDVDAGAERAERIELPLAGDLAPGAYVASWRVLSVDGHATGGHAVFVIGKGTN